jgi:DNA repair protein RadD
MSSRYTIFDLLDRSARTRSFVDERVARTVSGLVRDGLVRVMPPDTVLAIACLGDPISAIRRLASASVLPDELPDEQRHELSARLSLGPEELTPRNVLGDAGAVAVFLGLPEARSDRSTALPTAAAPAYGLFPASSRPGSVPAEKGPHPPIAAHADGVGQNPHDVEPGMRLPA